jgi:phage tail protein X
MTYVTKAGDMWDAIAAQVYGSAAHTSRLIMANPEYADLYCLPAGLVLDVPDLTETDVDASHVPPWRRS